MYWLTQFLWPLVKPWGSTLVWNGLFTTGILDRSQCRSHPVLAAAPIKRCTDRLYKGSGCSGGIHLIPLLLYSSSSSSSASLYFQYSTTVWVINLAASVFFDLGCCWGFSSCADCRMDQTKETAQSAQTKMGDTMQTGHNKASVIAVYI